MRNISSRTRIPLGAGAAPKWQWHAFEYHTRVKSIRPSDIPKIGLMYIEASLGCALSTDPQNVESFDFTVGLNY